MFCQILEFSISYLILGNYVKKPVLPASSLWHQHSVLYNVFVMAPEIETKCAIILPRGIFHTHKGLVSNLFSYYTLPAIFV